MASVKHFLLESSPKCGIYLLENLSSWLISKISHMRKYVAMQHLIRCNENIAFKISKLSTLWKKQIIYTPYRLCTLH